MACNVSTLLQVTLGELGRPVYFISTYISPVESSYVMSVISIFVNVGAGAALTGLAKAIIITSDNITDDSIVYNLFII